MPWAQRGAFRGALHKRRRQDHPAVGSRKTATGTVPAQRSSTTVLQRVRDTARERA